MERHIQEFTITITLSGNSSFLTVSILQCATLVKRVASLDKSSPPLFSEFQRFLEADLSLLG